MAASVGEHKAKEEEPPFVGEDTDLQQLDGDHTGRTMVKPGFGQPPGACPPIPHLGYSLVCMAFTTSLASVILTPLSLPPQLGFFKRQYKDMMSEAGPEDAQPQ